MEKKDIERQEPRALIIDDEAGICSALEGVLSDEGWCVSIARNGKEGIVKYMRDRPDIVLLDVWMPGIDGIDTLQKLKQIDTEVPVVIMSGHGSIGTAVRATKLGAFDYLEKPLSLDKILPMLEHAKELKNRREQRIISRESINELIGDSDVMVQIKNQMALVASRNAWILITGENGTGKEVLAQNLHRNSPRSKKPFVAVNCAAIPEQLIESELFGHVKGAFTNALASKRGKFELANQGTIFLDEIGDMSLQTQAKILRILQEQSFEKIGGTESIAVDVRVIAATNKDLAEEIKKGNFREDLYYRLNVVPFHMPSLRDRENDTLVLAHHFLQRMAIELGEKKKTLSPEVEKAFLQHRWPGNVRELKNTLERLCIMVPRDVIILSDLEEPLRNKDITNVNVNELSPISVEAATLKEAKVDFEKGFILGKLEENQWNVSRTAEAIGLERSNLHKKLKAYGIDPKQLKG